MVAPTPIIVVDHPTDSQKWVVLHRDGKFYEKHKFCMTTPAIMHSA